MEVTYQLAYSDFRQVEIYVQNRMGSMSPRIKLVVVMGIILAASALSDFTSPSHSNGPSNPLVRLATFLLPLALIPLIWFIQFKIALIRQEKEFNADPANLTPHTIHLDPENILAQDSTGESKTKWSAVCDVVDDNNAIYLFTSDKIAFLVPKRAFSTQNEAQAFYEEAQNFWRQAKA